MLCGNTSSRDMSAASLSDKPMVQRGKQFAGPMMSVRRVRLAGRLFLIYGTIGMTAWSKRVCPLA